MTRTILAFATGPHEELLEIALPSFHEFGDRHGYDVHVPTLDGDRPPSWWKVPAIRDALNVYDEVLYLDADTVIVDPADDLDVPGRAWQAMVEHHTSCGAVPNCGVWLVRKPMIPVLDRVWNMTHHIHHGWWEQAAICELLGYDGSPQRRLRTTPLYDRTFFLDNGWNVHMNDATEITRPRVMHATMHHDRAGVMREWTSAVCVS